MWRKAEITPPWMLPPSSRQEAWSMAPHEREELIVEAIDCLDYAEEKLLKLEYSPENLACLRRLQSTFVRLYDIAWALRFRPIFSLVQRVRAFLSYARHENTSVEREDLSKLFELCSTLQAEFTFLREANEEHAQGGPPRVLPPALHDRHRQMFAWLHTRLQTVEELNEMRVEGHSSRGLIPAPQIAAPRSCEATECSPCRELGTLTQLLEACSAQLSQMQGLVAHSPELIRSMEELEALHQSLHSQMARLLTRPAPTSSLFGLVVGFQDRYFFLPTSTILDILPANEVILDEWSRQDSCVLWQNEERLPLYSLGDFLPTLESSGTGEFESFPSRTPRNAAMKPTPSGQIFVVVLDTPQGPCCLWVEQILREMMIELVSMQGQLEAPFLTGGGRLPDGEAVWMIDPSLLHDADELA